MEIKPELKRALKHYENFIKVVVKNRDNLDVYLASTKTWSEEELIFMRDYWDIDHNVNHSEDIHEELPVVDGCLNGCDCECEDCDEYTCNCDCDDNDAIESMDKLELEAYAIAEYGVDIDRRLSKETLIKQINELEDKD